MVDGSNEDVTENRSSQVQDGNNEEQSSAEQVAAEARVALLRSELASERARIASHMSRLSQIQQERRVLDTTLRHLRLEAELQLRRRQLRELEDLRAEFHAAAAAREGAQTDDQEDQREEPRQDNLSVKTEPVEQDASTSSPESSPERAATCDSGAETPGDEAEDGDVMQVERDGNHRHHLPLALPTETDIMGDVEADDGEAIAVERELEAAQTGDNDGETSSGQDIAELQSRVQSMSSDANQTVGQLQNYIGEANRLMAETENLQNLRSEIESLRNAVTARREALACLRRTSALNQALAQRLRLDSESLRTQLAHLQGAQALIESSANMLGESSVQRGLTEEQMAELTVVKFKLKGEPEMCVICQDTINDDDQGFKLACVHEFHLQCMKSWLSVADHCPLCKVSVLTAE